MHILGKEAMVSNPQGSVAGGHVARSTGGHLPDSGYRHPSDHCGHTNLHGPQGKQVNPVSRQITGFIRFTYFLRDWLSLRSCQQRQHTAKKWSHVAL